MTALQFEATWDNLTTEMEGVGLGKSVEDYYIQYLEKVGNDEGGQTRPAPTAASHLAVRAHP